MLTTNTDMTDASSVRTWAELIRLADEEAASAVGHISHIPRSRAEDRDARQAQHFTLASGMRMVATVLFTASLVHFSLYIQSGIDGNYVMRHIWLAILTLLIGFGCLSLQSLNDLVTASEQDRLQSLQRRFTAVDDAVQTWLAQGFKITRRELRAIDAWVYVVDTKARHSPHRLEAEKLLATTVRRSDRYASTLD